jgi:hypothetical protein
LNNTPHQYNQRTAQSPLAAEGFAMQNLVALIVLQVTRGFAMLIEAHLALEA